MKNTKKSRTTKDSWKMSDRDYYFELGRKVGKEELQDKLCELLGINERLSLLKFHTGLEKE